MKLSYLVWGGVGLVGLLAGLGLVAAWLSVDESIQEGSELVVFSIVDADSGKPIRKAGIELRADGEDVQRVETDSAGHAAVVSRYKRKIVESWLGLSSRSLKSVRVHAAADGYSTYVFDLNDLRGVTGDDSRLPSSILVQLAKKGSQARGAVEASEEDVTTRSNGSNDESESSPSKDPFAD